MVYSLIKLSVVCALLPLTHGDYPPNGTYVYHNETEDGVLWVEYTISFPYLNPHRVNMFICCWDAMGLTGWYPLKEFDVPEGCSLDLRNPDDAKDWSELSHKCANGAEKAGYLMQPGDLETLITKTDAGGKPYIELSFSNTKLHLKLDHLA